MEEIKGGTPILEVRDLHKAYGKVKAVDGISFAVREGSCFGILGPNGAGKTTAIEVIETIHEPDSGRSFTGASPSPAPSRRTSAYNSRTPRSRNS